ncbi:MAG TPA: hypothetical protein VHP83_24825, partial [Aggregatilineaceae bacterium]|nr:hypothetical protein [Aggregatilineaceae bacterium]
AVDRLELSGREYFLIFVDIHKKEWMNPRFTDFHKSMLSVVTGLHEIGFQSGVRKGVASSQVRRFLVGTIVALAIITVSIVLPVWVIAQIRDGFVPFVLVISFLFALLATDLVLSLMYEQGPGFGHQILKSLVERIDILKDFLLQNGNNADDDKTDKDN